MVVAFDKYVEKIIRGKTVLSLGCAGYVEAGTFSKQFQKLKESAGKVYGLDVDKEFTAKYNQDKNLFYGDLNKFDWFDQVPEDVKVIVMTEVLEHLEAPVRTLRYIKSKKTKDCRVLVSVPNGGSLGRVILGVLGAKMFSFQDRHHLCVFNETTVRNCCKKAGLNILEVRPYIRSNRQKALRFCPHLAGGFFVLCQ